MKRFLFFVMAIMAGLTLAGQSFALQTVEGDITSNTTWSQDVLLRGPVFVRSGATLTINPGVTVFGEKATLGTLIIDRGAKLNAVGTDAKPVVYTSDQPEDSRNRADNGGLIINGYSTLNVPGGTKEGEGDTGTFGCSGADCNENDNSGTLRYFRVEYGGIQFSPDNELNGIAFQGVGRGTTVDHVQVAYSKDDCVEFFGGTVNVKNIIVTACGDDSLDWTDGWRGNGQFIVMQQLGDEADNGIEADNLDKANDNLPRSNPTLYNMTLVGDPDFGTGSTNGMLLRRGTAGNIRNSIVMGFKKSGVNLDSLATFTQAKEGNLIVDNNIFWNNKPNFDTDASDKDVAKLPFTTEQFMKNTMKNNKEVDPKLGNPYNSVEPDLRPAAGSPATDGTVPVAAPPAGNSFIVATTYIGAVDPANDWTRRPWTKYGIRDEDGDQVGQPEDCDDSDPTVFPGAVELCGDNKDNNCSGQVDEGCGSGCTDADKDGFSIEGGACGPVDCNDASAAINPNATEICGDGVDNNCNGQIDENCSSTPSCPATQVLGAQNSRLDALRSFRDTVMGQSLKGMLYTRLYYVYGGEVSAIIAADASLRAEAAAVLDTLQPAIDEALGSGNIILTAGQKAQIEPVLEKISSRASFGLRLIIRKLQQDLNTGDLL